MAPGPLGVGRAAEHGAGGPREPACLAAAFQPGLAGSAVEEAPPGRVRLAVRVGVAPSPPVSLGLGRPAGSSPVVGFGCAQRRESRLLGQTSSLKTARDGA